MTLDDSAGREEHAIDHGLVREVAGGSSDALGHLYDRHAAKVYGLARRVLVKSEDAEEVVQDVFAQVWRDASRYRPEKATVVGWLVMLARARAIDRLRARRARPDQDRGLDPTPALAKASTGATPEGVSISAEDARRVKGALAALPEPSRTLVELAYYEGLSHSEIADRTGTPLGTVKTRLRSAMATLRGALTS